VSVVINTYRRPESLRRAIGSARAQSYEPKEIIVVDSAPAHDGEPETRTSGVTTIRTDDHGACAARNLGVRAAAGALVALIDDDTYFPSADELERLVAAFERRPEASCIAFKIVDSSGRTLLRDWCHPRSYWESADTAFPTDFITEGGSAFRRGDFLRVGGYYEPFWVGNEGWDLSLRLLDADLGIVYEPTVRLCHAVESEGRTPGRVYRLRLRNEVWTAFKDYRGWRRWRFLAYSVLLMAFWGARGGLWREFARGLGDGVRGIGRVSRTPISPLGWQRLAAVRRMRPGVVTRIRKLLLLLSQRFPL
jgi:GT2 family glycosyltransferase